MTGPSHTLFVIGIVMILAGPLIMFFGDRRHPKAGRMRHLLILRQRPGATSAEESPHRALFGAAVLFAGVLVLLRALNVL